ncbi:hypothetical protein GE21DRAFT_5967 [Neurospora crassa]|uniref:Uncharacterized protein n=1 Tax=Neurospora crassa (strain ATCC 24698 / 74-OR23-1A / CBS 708.71 / DSM 1257 / FGSC 987) TaxID=367110 RepID=Q7SAE2_NEUCR|nr:hypothetical protein NCU06288 [Neurospora crassa OR74A]EAA33314.1 hypothetical protein NCU06288 [Neurospora crassa OR74A]KHE83176.1 hypothetical protein GE21DRAFT_5967 [Neurospora crassa]|eukprot:XP_962550.1 hypothetical protein NCU06288 [Neurospora crassa OR74A]
MASTSWRPNMTLKECLLPMRGMLWKDRPHILRSLEYDEYVLRSFRENYIPIAPGNISFEVTMCVFVANQKVGRHHKAVDYAPGKEYDFFAKISRFNRTGRKLPQHVYAELFRELIAARVRFMRRHRDSTETPSELAVQLSELVRHMYGRYSDEDLSRRIDEEILKAKEEQASSKGGNLGEAESTELSKDLEPSAHD